MNLHKNTRRGQNCYVTVANMENPASVDEVYTLPPGYEYLANLTDEELYEYMTRNAASSNSQYGGGILEDEETEKEFVAVAVFYSFIFLLGIIGNTLVIYCIARYKRMKSITNQLLLSLACADLLLTLICVPVKFAELFSYGWMMGKWTCIITYYIQVWSMITSIMTLTTISLERYYAISRPLRAKYLCTTSHARLVILVIWVVSSILALPNLFVQEYYEVGMTGYEPQRIYWCNKRWDSKGKTLAVIYEVYMLLVLFIIPVVIMVFSYTGVGVELWMVTSDYKSTSVEDTKLGQEDIGGMDSDVQSIVATHRETPYARGYSVSNKSDDSQSEKLMRKSHNKDAQIRRQVINMLITVVAIFILCWGPLLCFNLAVACEAIIPYLPGRYPYAKPLKTAFYLLAYSNSCLNPIVYGFMSRYFRKSFKQALSTCCILSNQAYGSFVQTPYIQADRSSSSIRKREEGGDNINNNSKRFTLTTTVPADSTNNSSPPVTPGSTCQMDEESMPDNMYGRKVTVTSNI